VRTIANADGSVQVLLGNNSVVDGTSARRLRVSESGGALAIKLEGSDDPMLPVGGALTSMVEFLNGDLGEVQRRLDTLAGSLVARVNAAHAQGQVFDSTGAASAAPAFYHPGDVADPGPPVVRVPVTARNIRLSDAVAASATNVAASAASPGPGQTAGPGNNEIALLMAGLRSEAGTVTFVTAGGTTERASFTDFYRETASRLGAEVKDAESSANVHQTLADQAQRRRMSTSGVNLDEELTTLMRAQQAYAAAAKVISAAEEMMRYLVEMV
jgi:flagellar hook-associated protein 1 FlgK